MSYLLRSEEFWGKMSKRRGKLTIANTRSAKYSTSCLICMHHLPRSFCYDFEEVLTINLGYILNYPILLDTALLLTVPNPAGLTEQADTLGSDKILSHGNLTV